MTVIETHPEELLDRELRGTLNERERHLLMAHLQRCCACRMERQLRVDFERELAVSAQSLDLQMFVSDAIDAMEQQPGAAASLGAARPLRAASGQSTHVAQGAARVGWSALRPVAVLMLVCVALSAGVGIGAAQLGLAERAWQLVRAGMDATFGVPPARPQPRTTRERHDPQAAAGDRSGAAVRGDEPASAAPAGERVLAGATVEPAARTEIPVETPQRDLEPNLAPAAAAPQLAGEPEGDPARAELAPVELRVPARTAATSQLGATVAAHPAQRTDHGPARGASAPESVPAVRNPAHGDASAPRPDGRAPAPIAAVTLPEAPRAPITSGAARLFEEANRIRHQGQAPEASGLYRELQVRYPNSAEARLSVALVARMQLDQGESAAALAGFESYLASSDIALREESMVGRVRALSRLGRDEEARSAAQTLLALYPDTAFAPAARKLLEPPVP